MLSPAGVKEHWLVKMYPSNNTRIHPIMQTKYVHRITDMPRPDVRNGDGGRYDTEARRSTSTRDSGKTSPGHPWTWASAHPSGLHLQGLEDMKAQLKPRTKLPRLGKRKPVPQSIRRKTHLGRKPLEEDLGKLFSACLPLLEVKVVLP